MSRQRTSSCVLRMHAFADKRSFPFDEEDGITVKNLLRATELVCGIAVGADAWGCICEAMVLSRNNGWRDENGALVKFTLNGVTVSVRSNSDRELLYRDYMRAAANSRADNNVGP